MDVNRTNAPKEFDIFHYWYFLDEPYLCNGCHDLMQKVMNFNDAAIVSVKESNYRIRFWYVSKNYVINIMKNSILNENSGLL